ncbi:hypothetical protein WJX72_005781 [[Myrmecia] bisecta]|uniref:Glycosyl transferase CAP10 domain-containing protein n=1 Tax=[Myrmecia] bisecta TaxID=41462 RepID=A0AAW1PTH1_9CHLO
MTTTNLARAWWLQDMSTDVPKSQWHGSITRQAMDEKCPQYVWDSLQPDAALVRYKILHNRLYVHQERLAYQASTEGLGPALADRRAAFEEMALVMLYLYKLPDLEFLVSFMDETVNGCPALSYAMEARNASATGFLYPSYSVWRAATTPMQARSYMRCLDKSYPDENRYLKAVWRGSDTTDQVWKIFGSKALVSTTTATWLTVRRMRLAVLGMLFPDILDAGLVQVISADVETRAWWQTWAPLKESIAFEDYNQYVAVLDLDGNSWSDRFAALLPFNTLIVKQDPDYTEYFYSWLQPGKHFLTFKEGLEDLVTVMSNVLDMWRTDFKGIKTIVRNAQDFAATKFTHPQVCLALARTLCAFRDKMHSAAKMALQMASDGLMVMAVSCQDLGKPASLRVGQRGGTEGVKDK